MSENLRDIPLEKIALPLYKNGFLVLAVDSVEVDGQYGTYQWGYKVRLKSATNAGKVYAVKLRNDDSTLGSILWVWHETPNKGIVFSSTAAGLILGTAKAFKDEAIDQQSPSA